MPIIQEKKQNSKKLRKGISSAAASTNSFSASSCIGFNLGTGIYGQLDYAGQEKCYFTNVSETTKLEALLINLPSGVNYDFYMLKYDSSGVYPTLDFSTNTSNTNEFTYSVVDPGTYLLIVKGVSGFSSSQNFIIGALGHSDYDQFEANDRANIATALTGNTISSGNLDNNGDFDYFAYTFESNQTDSRISFDGKAFHQLELFTGSGWSIVPGAGQVFPISGNPGNTAYLRVRTTPSSTSNTTDTYNMRLANPSKKIINTNVWSNENLTNLATFNLAEANNTINFSGTVVDALGRKLEGDTVVVTIDHNQGSEEIQLKSNSQGGFSVNFTLPDCSGSQNELRWTYGTPKMQWNTSFDIENFAIHIPYSLPDGSLDYFRINGQYAHICTETLVQTIY